MRLQAAVLISLSLGSQDRAPGILHLLPGTSMSPLEKGQAGGLPAGDSGHGAGGKCVFLKPLSMARTPKQL